MSYKSMLFKLCKNVKRLTQAIEIEQKFLNKIEAIPIHTAKDL
jgi:hypothetical protein